MRKLKVQKAPIGDCKTLQEKAAKMEAGQKELTLLTAFNHIVELAEESELKPEFFKLANRYIQYVSERQGITPVQAVMLALSIEESATGNHVSLSDLARFLMCRSIRLIEYQTDIDELVRRGLLYQGKRCDDSKYYFIPNRMIESLKKNEAYQKVSYSGCTGLQFFQHFYDITHLRHEEHLSTELMLQEVKRLFEENKCCHYVKVLRSLDLKEESALVVTQLSRHLILCGEDSISINHIAFLFDDLHERSVFARSMDDGSHELITNGLVERDYDGGFKSQENYRLTNHARSELLKDYKIKVIEDDAQCDLIKYDTIASKDFFLRNIFSNSCMIWPNSSAKNTTSRSVHA